MKEIKPLSPIKLFLTLLRISATTLGGGAVMVGVIRAEMLRLNALDPDKVDDILTLSLSTPGAMAMSMSWQVGWYMGGFLYALIAIVAVGLPPFITFVFLANWLLAHSTSPHFAAFFNGAGAGVVALLAWIIFSIGKRSLRLPWEYIFAVALSVCMILFKLPALWALLGGTIASLIVVLAIERWKAR